MRSVTHLVIHQSDSGFGTATVIDGWHKERFPADADGKFIGYHRVILNGHRSKRAAYDPALDGMIQNGRDYRNKGCHVEYHNAHSIGICCIGKGDAIDFALRHSDSDYRYVVLTDADYTYPAAFVPQMVKILDEHPDVGMVSGNRFNSHLHKEAMHDTNYIGNQILAFAQSMLNGVTMRDPLTGLRVIRWEILKDWRPKSDGFDIEVEMNRFVRKKGYRIVEIEIPYRQRLGDKKLRLSHGFTILKRIISENASSP